MEQQTFPFKPTKLFHRHGGQITTVYGVGHTCDKPSEGRSRDYWFYRAEVKWNDGSTSERAEVAPYAVCIDGDEADGKAEYDVLSDALNAYLLANGEWCDRKSKHEGWYANERPAKRGAK